MSEFRAHISWKGASTSSSAPFTYETYNRDHLIVFGSGTTIEASSAPEFRGDANKTNPEEQFVAALSACHMLTFLAICARKRVVVLAYDDDAFGSMSKNAEGKLWVSDVTLRPQVSFAPPTPTKEHVLTWHALSHQECFIANSVKTTVRVRAQA